MAKPPYRIARQDHVGEMLDALQERGRLAWRWDYDDQRHQAIYNVRLVGGPWKRHGTRAVESVVQAECDALGILWLPVPHPGGEAQHREVYQRLAK